MSCDVQCLDTIGSKMSLPYEKHHLVISNYVNNKSSFSLKQIQHLRGATPYLNNTVSSNDLQKKAHRSQYHEQEQHYDSKALTTMPIFLFSDAETSSTASPSTMFINWSNPRRVPDTFLPLLMWRDIVLSR